MSTDVVTHARALLAVLRRIQELQELQDSPRPPLWHPLQLLRHSAVLRETPWRLEALAEMQGHHARELRRLGAGATPGTWGPFSVAHSGRVCVEDALDSFSGDARADRLRLELPVIRAKAATENPDIWTRYVDEHLAAIVGTGPLQSSWGRAALWEFISVERRPQPEHAWHLMRTSKLIRLTLTDGDRLEDPEPTIVIGNISTHGLQGLGIGTAALREICRYADAKQMRIRANIEPLDAGDPAFLRLAAWYHRHGFRQGDRPAVEWMPLGEMIRLPQPPI